MLLGVRSPRRGAVRGDLGGVFVSDDKWPEKVYVESYSGYKVNERPTLFILKDRQVGVVDILDRWYGPEDDFFKVLADDGGVYLLKWRRFADEWYLLKAVERPGSVCLFS